jgi:hypothetical protein
VGSPLRACHFRLRYRDVLGGRGNNEFRTLNHVSEHRPKSWLTLGISLSIVTQD